MAVNRWIASAAALAALGGCVVGPTERETKTLSYADFDSINAHSGIDVVLKQGPFSVTAEAPKGELDKIIIEKRGSTLDIGRKEEMQLFSFGIGRKFLVTVAAPTYTSIEVSGGADANIDPLKAEALTLRAHGGADVDLAGLAAARLTVSASGGADVDAKGLQLGDVSSSSSGGGDVKLAGSCRTITIEASGGGDFSGRDMRCGSATASASSGGDVDIYVDGGAAVGSASGGGDVTFHGNPSSVQKTESGGGDVHAPDTAHPAPA